MNRPRTSPKFCTSLAAVVLMLLVSGCEVGTLYGIRLDSYASYGQWKTAPTDHFTLYLVESNSPEIPGITLVAQMNDRRVPAWDWGEFQTWSEEKRSSTFGDYYDQVYLELDVSHRFDCAVSIEYFDHRDDAQNAAYGRWLHSLPMTDTLDEPLKGVFISFPISGCEELFESPDGKSRTFGVAVTDVAGEELGQVEINFELEVLETYINWLF